MKKIIFILAALFLGSNYSVQSQPDNKSRDLSNNKLQDSTNLVLKRNVLKWNVTPMMWSRSNINLSYERVTSNHGSFSINAGYFVLPSAGLFDSLDILKSRNKWGFSVAGDKRYYFKKRNTGITPDGLYWGFFGSVHHYEFENNFEVIGSEVVQGELTLNGNLSILTAGVELGYQFVLKNNITIDLIFIGPAISTYSGKLAISGNLKVDKESEYIKAIYDVLVKRFPGADNLLKEKSIKNNGTVFSLGPGYRYMLQIGYRF